MRRRPSRTRQAWLGVSPDGTHLFTWRRADTPADDLGLQVVDIAHLAGADGRPDRRAYGQPVWMGAGCSSSIRRPGRGPARAAATQRGPRDPSRRAAERARRRRRAPKSPSLARTSSSVQRRPVRRRSCLCQPRRTSARRCNRVSTTVATTRRRGARSRDARSTAGRAASAVSLPVVRHAACSAERRRAVLRGLAAAACRRSSSATSSPATTAPGIRRCALSDALYRCITYSHRGFPPSSVPDDPEAYSQDLLIEDLRALVEHLGLDAGALRRLLDGRQRRAELRAALSRACAAPSSWSATGAGTTNRERFERDIEQVVELIAHAAASTASPRRTPRARRACRSSAKTRTAGRSFDASWPSTRRSARR